MVIEVENWSDKRNWLKYITYNQPGYIEHINRKNPIKKRKELSEYLGYDYLSDIIREEREEKIKKIIE